MTQKIPPHLRYLFSVYLSGMFLFTFFRVVLLIVEKSQLSILPNPVSLIGQAFVMGLRFDTVVSGYILLLPLLVLSVAFSAGWRKKALFQGVHFFLVLMYLAAFFLSAADIPYFDHFFDRLNITVLSWTDNTAFSAKMIVEDMTYLTSVICYVLLAVFFSRWMNRLKKNILFKSLDSAQSFSGYRLAPISLVAFGLLFLGMRGRVAFKSPIRTGTAYFCDYSFPNQLGLNPVFTFIRSVLDTARPEGKTLHLVDDNIALKNACAWLQADTSGRFDSPIARIQDSSAQSIRPNVVVIMMESMSAFKMGRFGNPDHLTPVLDSLARVSYCFDSIYSAGTHTFNGLYGTLFSYPALLRQHPLKGVNIPEMTGFPGVMKEKGYQTIFFTTHDGQFDNMEGFFKFNHFEQFISQKDYPSEQVLSTLGVPDEYMFDFGVPILNNMSQKDKPFFAAFLTTSDHSPFLIPEKTNFKARNTEMKKKIVEYADYSIGKFLRECAQYPWFENTLFVILADHGGIIGDNPYDMPLSYHHEPLIIYAPKYLKPQVFPQLGGQIDVFPTVMGILGMPYVNNTFGIDLLRQQRPFSYFSADDKIGCLDKEFFFIHRDNGIETLHRYRNNDTQNYIKDYPAKADSMRNYAFSMMQASQWVRGHGKSGRQSPHQ